MSKSAKRFFSTITLVILLITIFSWQSPNASASTLVQLSDTLSRIKAGVSSTHTIIFKVPSGLDKSGNQRIKISFPTSTGNFNFGGATSSSNIVDVDIATSTALGGTYTEQGIVGGTAQNSTNFTFATSTSGAGLIFTFIGPDNNSTPSSTYVRIKIGTNASNGGAGTLNLVNPGSATSSMITITTTDASGNVIDRGYLSVITVADDQVAVSATVLSTLSFDWWATSSATTNGQDCTSQSASTTNRNAIEFGTLGTAAKIACQRLWVATNAANGFSVTAQQDHNLWQNGSTTLDIDSFKDGVAPSASTTGTWTAPLGTVNSELTYGHFGFTSSDGVVSAVASSTMFTNAFFGGFNGTSTFEVFYHNSPVNATTSGDGQGFADVVYKIQISVLQEAGDYNNTLTYVATAVF